MDYYIANLLIILVTFISTIIYSNNAEEIKNMNKIYTPIIVNDKTKNTNFPTQIHLAYTGIPTEMMISYSTNYSTDNTIAKVRLHSNHNNGNNKEWTHTFNGNSKIFVDGGARKNSQYLHYVKITGLQLGTTYDYIVGDTNNNSNNVFSPIQTFTSMRSKENKTEEGRPWRFILLADLGLENDDTLANITTEVTTAAKDGKPFDSVLHAGDLAYDFHSKEGQVGDDFMNAIQPISSIIPYMVCPGNHESRYNFSHYRARFNMPNSEETENLWYSFDLGPIHFVSYSTESYFDYEKGKALNSTLKRQYDWLKNDLMIANKPENRKLRPWIIVQGHRPFYCTNTFNVSEDGCGPEQETSRHGSYKPNAPYVYAIEPLMFQYGVDLFIAGHVHDYTRYWPVYNLTVQNGTDDPLNPYHNPSATTYLTIGAAGNHEMHLHDQCIKNQGCVYPTGTSYSGPPSPFAACTAGTSPECIDFNYGRMTVYNNTHLYWSQYSSTQNKVVDEMWLIQEHHGSFGNVNV